jgi:hypothetical protein
MKLKQEKQDNWFARHKVLTGVLGIIVFVAIVSAASGNKPTANTSQPVAADSATQPAQTASAPAAPKTWQKVAELSGDTSKRSTPFTLSGGQARLKYTVNGNSSLVAFYVMEQGKDLQKDGGFPEVTVTKTATDETQLTKAAGTYFLDVTAANASWTVTIEEMK